MKYAYWLGIVTGIFLALFSVTPAYAMDEPDSVSLYNIEIFQDLIYDDDFLAIVPYNIQFTTQPDDDIDDTFIFSIVGSDNSTEYGTSLAYPRYYGGYGKGIVSFYFESGMIWEEPYTFRVQQNPVYYPSPQTWDFSIGTSAYSQDSNQALALRAKIIDSALELSTEWEIDLLASSDSGMTVLSTYGELYYLNAVPGLQSMSPALFSVQIETPDFEKRSWDFTLANTLMTRYAGTMFGDLMTGFAGLFSMDETSAMNVVSIIIFAVVIGVCCYFFKANMSSAFIDGYDFLLLLMLHGFFSMIFAGIMAFLSVLVGGVILFLNRA